MLSHLVMHAFAGRCLALPPPSPRSHVETVTVQAPQIPSPHTRFVPVRRRESRR